MFEQLKLEPIRTPFEKKIKRLVSQSNLHDIYDVLEDTTTNPEFTRAFAAPVIPPYHGFVPIYMFCEPRNAIHEHRRKQPKNGMIGKRSV